VTCPAQRGRLCLEFVKDEYQAVSQFDGKTLSFGSALHMRNRHPIFVIFRYFYLILVPIGVFLMIAGKGGDKTIGFLCIVIGPILFMRKVLWQFRLMQGAKSSPEVGQSLQWVFSEKSVSQESKGYSKSFQWGDFVDFYATSRGFLLYLEKDRYFVVPRNSFENEEDFVAVSQLCKSKIDSEI